MRVSINLKDFEARTSVIFIPLFIFFACSGDRVNTIGVEPDSISKKEQLSSNNKIELITNDSLTYIGFIEKFHQNMEEFYVELYFLKDSITTEEYNKLSGMGDSVIYQDDEASRTRIPYKVAKENFNLSGLEPLSVFDEKHNFLSKAHLVRVEYLNQTISSPFAAVFKTENSILNKAHYCIGNFMGKTEPVLYNSFEDSILTQTLSKRHGISISSYSQVQHYKKGDFGTIWSVISTDTSYIIEKGNLLYKSDEMESIFSLVFIPIKRNGKPVLLARAGIPESDVMWDQLLVYDGKQYRVQARQRINLKKSYNQ